MKKLVIILFLVPFLGLGQKDSATHTIALAFSKVDFTGNWAINLKKTDYGQAPEWILPRSIEIKQKIDVIIIQSKAYDKQMVQHYYLEKIPFEGRLAETITYSNNKRMVSLNWNYDEKGFVLSVQLIMQDGKSPPAFTELWYLENGGKTLVIDRRATRADDFNVKAYYNKTK